MFKIEITNFLTGEICESSFYETKQKALEEAKKIIRGLTNNNKFWLQAKNDFQILVKISHESETD